MITQMKFIHFPPLLLILLLVNLMALILGHSYETNTGASRIRCLESERRALLNFKDELVGTNGRLSSWGNEEYKGDCCKWRGVYCDNRTNHVSRLDLNSGIEDAPLEGMISTSLLELQDLQYLDLSGNYFGQVCIPEFIGSLSKLWYLNLSYAGFRGPIPHHLGNLSILSYLDLSDNSFDQVCIPEFIGSLSKLRYVDLSYAGFREPIPHLGNLSRLSYLDLSDNSFDQKIPEFIGSLNKLRYLDLSGPSFCGSGFCAPSFCGPIPHHLGNLSRLLHLGLSYNFYFDQVRFPEFIGSLSKLRHLDLSNAHFSGPIPHHLGNLSNLLHLDLSFNPNCYSESLDWVSHLHSLKHLDLGGTNLSKATNWLQTISKQTSIQELQLSSSLLPEILPSSLPSMNASTPLTTLDFRSNSFNVSTLALISWFSNFSNTGLTSIYFGGNHMPGPIPDIFASMVSLTELSLYDTGLEGGIPNYFGNMSSLIYLDLSDNNLTGELSEIMKNLSGPVQENLQFLYLNNNSLSGSFPNMSRFSSLRKLYLQKNQLSRSIPEGYLKLPHLLRLDLSLNKFTGPLADLSFSSSLEYLDLSSNKFGGTLTECVGRLSNLRTLVIRSNLFEGTITEASVTNLSRLEVLDLSLNPSLIVKFDHYWGIPFQLHYLRLRHCKVGPHFPLWLKTQRQLIYIDISSAGISDNIPSWFGSVASNYAYLNASNNQITGVVPNYSFFPMSSAIVLTKTLDLSRNNISDSVTFLCHPREWDLIDLSDNHFFGHIPDCFSQFKSLNYLNLANNNLSGKIPHSFGSLSDLLLLHLRNNKFSGELPTSMANCTNLTMIDVGQNRLTGKVPAWIGDRLSKLKVLILRSNEFYGNLPLSLCGLAYIQILDISSNKISGVIPTCVHKYMAMTQGKNESILVTVYAADLQNPQSELLNQLQSVYFMWKGQEVKYVNNVGLVQIIDLSSNNLVGQIPSGITKLVGLVGLNFSANNLSGSIPHNIGELTLLNFLDFSRNHLSGSIPLSLGELTTLGVLNLSYNNLSGRIPQTTQMLTYELAYIGNPDLCGLPLNKSCPGDESHQDSDSSNNATNTEEFEEDKFITEGFYIALGLGFVVGFWGIFGMILLNDGMRYALFKVLNIVEDFVYVRAEIIKARLLRHFRNG